MTQALAAPSTASRPADDAAAALPPPGLTPAAPARAIGTPVAAPALATLKLYAGEWAGFVTWCRQQRRPALPASAETLAAYLLAAAPALSRGALGRRRAAIGAMHRQTGLPAPRLDAASRKALRAAAKPATANPPGQLPGRATLVRIAAKCPGDLSGLRDRALLLLAAATQRQVRHREGDGRPGRSRSDRSDAVSNDVPRLVMLALDAEDVRFTPAGVALQLRTRADQPAPNRTVTLTRSAVVNACPVRALEDWLRSSDTAFGPVFRKVDRWGNVEHTRLGDDAWHYILARRSGTPRPRARAPANGPR